MMSERATMPAAAPGEWTKGRTGLDAHEVRVAFAGARDAHAVREQIEGWLASLNHAGSRALLVPVVGAEPDATTLYYPAPRAIGANAIGAQVVGADPMAKYEPGAPKRALWLLSRVADALDDLHARGLVHGALAFPSIWWMPDGDVRFPDAALAHALEGLLPASPEVFVYRAPEVWHGGAPVPASDQYSLAVMAYELFTGRSRKDSATVEGILVVEPLMLEPNALAAAGAPPGLADVLQRAISASPRSRFESCSAFVAALTEAIERTQAAPIGERRAVRRPSLISTGSVTLVIAAIAVIAGAIAVARNQTAARRMLLSLRERMVPSALQSDASRRAATQGATQPATMTRGRMATTYDPQQSPTTDPRAPASTGGAQPPFRQQGATNPAAPNASGQRTTTAGAARSGATLQVPTMSASPTGALSGASRSVRGAATAIGAAGANAAGGKGSIGFPTTSSNAATSNPTTSNSSSANSATGRGASAGTIGASPPVASANEPRGTIVLTLPAGSRVYVDGVLVRSNERPSPTRTIMVAPGLHDIDVLTPQGASHKRRVTISALDTATLSIPGGK